MLHLLSILTHEWARGKLYTFLTSVLVEGEWITSCLRHFTPGDRFSHTHCKPDSVWTYWQRGKLMPSPGIECNCTCTICSLYISCIGMQQGQKITVASWYLTYREITVNGYPKHPYTVWFTLVSLLVVTVIVSPIILKIIIRTQQIRKQKRENDGSSGKY